MKRVYRVTVVAERTFERKATEQAKAMKALLKKTVEDEILWTVHRASVTNIAVPSKPPAPRPSERKLAVDAQLETLRGIILDMAAILLNVKRPRLHLFPNKWCEERPSGAHAHTRGWHKGLVCITAAEVMRTASGRTDAIWLMAHEITHLRYPSGSHNRRVFREGVDYLVTRYKAWRVSRTWQPLVRTPGWLEEK